MDTTGVIDMNMDKIMEKQPIINLGTIGHVANGKSTLVKCLTDKGTQQFTKEKERNITIRLGYANAKIWECSNCNAPVKYSSTGSAVMVEYCKICTTKMKLVTHISIVDCPGHNELTSTMLNGSSVMDYAILVESFSNDNIPAPQTSEHLIATSAADIKTCMVIMNKVDLVKKEKAHEKMNQIKKYMEGKTKDDLPIIPLSATFKANIDVVCEIISKLTVPMTRDFNLPFKMIVIRSFDINKPGIDVCELNGGVIGGTITQGCLKNGDTISIYPGLVRAIDRSDEINESNENNLKSETRFRYEPIIGKVLSIKSETTELEYAVSGGLLGIQLTIDPAFAKGDNLSGSLVIKDDDSSFTNDNINIKVVDSVVIQMTNYIIDKKTANKLLRQKPQLMMNINSNNIFCSVYDYDKKTKYAKLRLETPVAIDQDFASNKYNMVTLINTNVTKDIIGRAAVITGTVCEKLNFD